MKKYIPIFGVFNEFKGGDIEFCIWFAYQIFSIGTISFIVISWLFCLIGLK